jgi:carboxymethylenebutenolidase
MRLIVGTAAAVITSIATVEARIASPDTTFPAWVTTPDSAGPWPGVVVIHDALGMTDDVHNQCAWLAEAGYLAVAPDLYSRGWKLTCIRQVFKDLGNRAGPAFDDVEATRSWLADRDDCTGRIGVIGYCMGGAFSLLLAPGHGFAASSVNYGHVPDDADALLTGACPVIGSYGARDRTLKGAADKLRVALETNDIDHEVKEYLSAGHSFLNDHRGGAGVLMRVFGPLMGGGYDEDAARDARARITAFFDQHLTTGPESDS